MNESALPFVLIVASSKSELAYWETVVPSWPGASGSVQLIDGRELVESSPTNLVASGPATLSWRVLESVQARRPKVLMGMASSGALALTCRARDLGVLEWPLRVVAWHDAPFALDEVRGSRLLDDPLLLDLDSLQRETVARADILVAPDSTASMPAALWPDQQRIFAVPRHATVWRGLADRALRRELPGDPEHWPSVSVCVTHYQRPALLQQALASIWTQEYPGEVEVIVVDDGSPDEAVQNDLNHIERELRARGGQLLRQTNRYLGAARNAAADLARHDLLMFVDDDDWLVPGYLLAFARALTRGGADLASCAFDYFVGVDAPTAATRIHHRWVMLGGAPVRQIAENSFGGANIAIHRTAFHELGGFTEDRDVGCEDWEFYHRAVLVNLTHIVVPAPLLMVRMGIGGMQQTAANFADGALRAVRPVTEAMPAAYRDTPLLLQGAVRRNTALTEQNTSLQRHRSQLQQQIRVLSQLVAAIEPSAIGQQRPNIPPSAEGPPCFVWHDEGMGVSGILSWMWRLRAQFAPAANLPLQLVDLNIHPYHSDQPPIPSVLLYDEYIGDADAFLDFLARTTHAVHVINHCYRYLDSLIVDGDDSLLRLLRLVAVCHTDQDFYYDNIERFAPYLRAIVSVSPTCTSELQRRLPQYADRIVTLPAWAVTPPPLEPRPRESEQPLQLLYTGRIVQHQKRVFDLAALAGQLGAIGANVSLTIVGDGPDLEQLRARMESIATPIVVTFLPACAPWEMPNLLSSHHALIQTSAFEGASVSLMEAMSFGLVPVVTRTQSGQELTRDGQNALTADIGDVPKLANHVARLAADDTLRLQLARSARATAVSYLEALDYPHRFADIIRRAGQ